MPVKTFFVEQFPKLVARLRRTRSDENGSMEAPKHTTTETVTCPNGHIAAVVVGMLGDFKRNKDGSRFSEALECQEPSSSNSTRSHIVFAELPSRPSSMEGKRTPTRPRTPYPSK
ncbi:hypothetical protein RBB50_011304 [Rhinocladiella similis]